MHYTLTYILDKKATRTMKHLSIFSIRCNIIYNYNCMYGRATEILTFYSSLNQSPYSSAVEIAKLYFNWLNDEQKFRISFVQ